MQCPRCLNEDSRYFYHGTRGWYCRKCIKFKRIYLDDDIAVDQNQIDIVDSSYTLSFQLTKEQQLAAKQVLAYNKMDYNVIINAVCGAGKTEIVYQTISYNLALGKRVGIAIPRRSVVLQLAQRLRENFPHLNVVAVCQGYTKVTKGDLIICTTHQLYRYYHFFDVLIIDECDAFPFANNEVLQMIAKTSCVGSLIYMSATMDDQFLQKIQSNKLKRVNLYKRPSNVALAIPKCTYGPKWLLLIKLYFLLSKRKRSLLVFVPTIKLANKFNFFFSKIFNCGCITSRTNNKEEVIAMFMNKQIDILFCTTILERGVTFSNIDVVIYLANHHVFNFASLVQIIGRVGRDIKYVNGDGYFLACRRTFALTECVKWLKEVNRSAYGVGSD